MHKPPSNTGGDIVDSGAYRGLVTFQKYDSGFDDVGNPVGDWNDYKKAYAYVNGLSGTEYWAVSYTHLHEL